jgi:hypothetical protein
MDRVGVRGRCGVTDTDDRKLLAVAVERFRPDIEKAYPVDTDLDKTLRFWTAEDLRRQDHAGTDALAAAMERAGVQRLGDLVDMWTAVVGEHDESMEAD